ncbi:hypothetical protein P7C70_g4141, partial [Phenoliferia sp. Uapishka_3]
MFILDQPSSPPRPSSQVTINSVVRDVRRLELKPSPAEKLPFHILVAIFFAARAGSQSFDFDQGGQVACWDSLGSTLPFSLVCRGWSDAAIFTLTRSIVILGTEKARLFLRTIKDHPYRANYVKSLVIGFKTRFPEEASTRDAYTESMLLVEVLEMCPMVTHLHVKPLHRNVRKRLLAAIKGKPSLAALVLLPRFDTPEAPLYEDFDLVPLMTKLDAFEVQMLPGRFTPRPRAIEPFLTAVTLRELRILCLGGNALILPIIAAAGPTLEVLDVYVEHLYECPGPVVDALLKTTKTLRRLKYITGPLDSIVGRTYDPTKLQVLDYVLPHFQQLLILTASASEVSPNLFRIIPPCVRKIELYALNRTPSFRYAGTMLDALADLTIDFKLEAMDVHGVGWARMEEVIIGAALASRGISFLTDNMTA